jgi:3-phosphoshikimate 1-carboxyvinyltransferase
LKPLKTTIKVPGDKSISHRGIIFAALAEGKTKLKNFLNGEDCLYTKKAFEELGVQIDWDSKKPSEITVYGSGFRALKNPEQEIYLGNSGTAMRLLTGLFAGLGLELSLLGDESLSSRPMKRILEPLELMGAKIFSNKGKAPLKIEKPISRLKGIDYFSQIASAQVKSSLLLAGLGAEGLTSLSEPTKSRDHTERMMRAFGIELSIEENSFYKVSILGQDVPRLKALDIDIPGDISSAAFFMVAASIVEGSEILLPNIGLNPTRTGILDLMKDSGVDISIENFRELNGEDRGDLFVKASPIKAFTVGGEIIPRLIDEIPVIAVLASQAQGITVIKDAEELKVKESNRILSTVKLLRAFGVTVEETADGMIIEGRAGKCFEPLEGAFVDSLGDHRIAMSAAIANLHSVRKLEILKTEFVETSFPGFFQILRVLEID